jgi:hypothetical protein
MEKGRREREGGGTQNGGGTKGGGGVQNEKGERGEGGRGEVYRMKREEGEPPGSAMSLVRLSFIEACLET